MLCPASPVLFKWQFLSTGPSLLTVKGVNSLPGALCVNSVIPWGCHLLLVHRSTWLWGVPFSKVWNAEPQQSLPCFTQTWSWFLPSSSSCTISYADMLLCFSWHFQPGSVLAHSAVSVRLVARWGALYVSFVPVFSFGFSRIPGELFLGEFWRRRKKNYVLKTTGIFSIKIILFSGLFPPVFWHVTRVLSI